MEQQIALVSEVLDAGSDVELWRQPVERPHVSNSIAFKALVGVTDSVAIVDRSKHAARIAHRAGERETVSGTPSGQQGRLPARDLGYELALSRLENGIGHDLGVGERDAPRKI